MNMETMYRRFGKVRQLPSTRQVKHELRHGFAPDFRPLPRHLSRWESEGGAPAVAGPVELPAPLVLAKGPGPVR
jgi:hypothetical protein